MLLVIIELPQLFQGRTRMVLRMQSEHEEVPHLPMASQMASFTALISYEINAITANLNLNPSFRR